ncbi:MAG TPA: dihydrolipoamide acetyltransferase family protein [Acidimicrobiia bacterium]|nr:dihydrolipoamide acetyltransferase family protein [Acidimicrobiia bacterium]
MTTMTVNEFPLPDLGEGLLEAEIIKWLVDEGDTVTQNQPIVEVETAKAAVEIPAKWPGRIVRIFHPEGATVQVGSPIVAIDTAPTAGAGSDGAQTTPAVGAPPQAPKASSDTERTPVLVGYGPRTAAVTRRPRKTTPPAQPAPPPPAPAPSTPAAATAPVLAKPPVRKLARDLGVDLRTIVGTGPSGSITRQDVEAAVASATTPAARERRIPIKGVRRTTAENVTASAFTAPHVTEFLTVDATRTMRALRRLGRHPEWRDVRISPLLLVAKAVLLAIKRHPMVNSTWDEAAGEIVVKDYVNLGIAAATPRGLIVPNIKDADRLSLRELADALTTLVTNAKAGRTTPAEMTGGTFTITNVGVFGVDTGTPILPPGEAAILALGAIQERPWVYKSKIRIRQVTTLGLSFDHRIIDGELGSRFLSDVGAFLTDPETALLAWT